MDILDRKMEFTLETYLGTFTFRSLSPKQSLRVSAKMVEGSKEAGYQNPKEWWDNDPMSAAEYNFALSLDEAATEKPEGFGSWTDVTDGKLFSEATDAWRKFNEFFREESPATA